jgi:(1->4)-alpha-D-glucan 1-alpha-D-glucosylmutase
VNIPRATYRLQLHADFTFRDARAIVPYLAALGVSHIYASPFLKARPGSRHGYDVTDHTALNPEIGTAADLDELCSTLRAHDMGLMLDLVPNHMGVQKADNPWWLDVLEHGEASRHAGFFDIDWHPESPELAGKVLIPILGDQYGVVLERGELELRFDAKAGELSLWYHEHRLPIRPGEYPRVLAPAVDALGDAGRAKIGAELATLAAAFERLREAANPDPDVAAAALKQRLARLCAGDDAVARSIEASVRAHNGIRGERASFDALDALIQKQAYRLAFWRAAADDINYRRFFDVNDLAALRAEREDVFELTHRIPLELVARGQADALRIDHPDGLLDPAAYFERLQRAAAGAMQRGAPDARGRAIYLVIEKILADHERMAEAWPVHGTTGYRFMNVVNGIFVDTSARTRFDRLYAAFIGEHAEFDVILRRAKTYILVHSLASELNRVTTQLDAIAKSDRRTRDYTRNGLRRALVDVIACFPVYRTYVSARGWSEDDRRHVDWAVAVAKRQSDAADRSVFDFIGAVLRGDVAPADAGTADAVLRFVQRFQQLTAPTTAKGMEDTSFYAYNRLASLNEVGGDPRTFGFTVQAFHGASQDRASVWPHTMLATSTHDNKRSEDARMRIDVLSEMPAAWRLALRRWRQINRRHRASLDGAPAPSANDEYLLYQTLLGAWPLEPLDETSLRAVRERMQAYMQKAVREAKVHTSWINPNADYEAALVRFVDGMLGTLEGNRFLDDFIPAQRRIARHGALNSLAQTLVKLTSPGVPDTYQGTELWDFSLVDPDNRRAVDYARRTEHLRAIQARAAQDPGALACALLDAWQDGRVKLWLTWRLLALRRERADWFARAGYLPLQARGEHARRVCAYARTGEGARLAVVVPRLWLDLVPDGDAWPLGPLWGDARILLPEGVAAWRNVLTDEEGSVRTGERARSVALGEILRTFPLALLDLA